MSCDNELSFLNGNAFQLTFNRIKDTVVYVQKTSIPGLTLPSVEISNPFVTSKELGDHINFDSFGIQFKLDQNLEGYLDIFNWIVEIGFPENFDQYKNAVQPDNRRSNLYGDATLLLYSNTLNSNLEVRFKNIHPTYISQIPFDTTITDDNPIDVTAQFDYDYFTVHKVT